jgi:hypothetical protein
VKHIPTKSKHHQDISPLVWLVFPLVSYVLLSGMLLSGFPSVVAGRLGGEQGVIENAQVVFLLLFLGLAGHMLCARTPLPHPRLRLWLILLTIGGLYTLVEEIS